MCRGLLVPRRSNDRPTLIYWLLDMRPETIAAGWHSGKPFYCGKTVEGLQVRMIGHRFNARRWPNRANSKIVTECGEHVRILLMETVPPGGNWAEKEKRWIALLRFSFPGATNVSDGGDGCPGMVMSEETKRKIGDGNRGRKPSPLAIAGSLATRAGKALPPDHIAKIRATLTGKPKSEAHRLAAMEAVAKVDRGPALRAAWQRRKARELIIKCHGPDVFKNCGIEHLVYPKRRRQSRVTS